MKSRYQSSSSCWNSNSDGHGTCGFSINSPSKFKQRCSLVLSLLAFWEFYLHFMVQKHHILIFDQKKLEYIYYSIVLHIKIIFHLWLRISNCLSIIWSTDHNKPAMTCFHRFGCLIYQEISKEYSCTETSSIILFIYLFNARKYTCSVLE